MTILSAQRAIGFGGAVLILWIGTSCSDRVDQALASHRHEDKAWALRTIAHRGTADEIQRDSTRKAIEDPRLVFEAAWALGRLGPDPKTEEYLLLAIQGSEGALRAALLWTLLEIAPNHTQVRQLTADAAKSSDPLVRLIASIPIAKSPQSRDR